MPTVYNISTWEDYLCTFKCYEKNTLLKKNTQLIDANTAFTNTVPTVFIHSVSTNTVFTNDSQLVVLQFYGLTITNKTVNCEAKRKIP